MIRFQNYVGFTESDAYKAILQHNKTVEKQVKKYQNELGKIERKNWTRETKDAEREKVSKPDYLIDVECISVLGTTFKPRGFSDTGSSLWFVSLGTREGKVLYNTDIWAETIAKKLEEEWLENQDSSV